MFWWRMGNNNLDCALVIHVTVTPPHRLITCIEGGIEFSKIIASTSSSSNNLFQQESPTPFRVGSTKQMSTAELRGR